LHSIFTGMLQGSTAAVLTLTRPPLHLLSYIFATKQSAFKTLPAFYSYSVLLIGLCIVNL